MCFNCSVQQTGFMWVLWSSLMTWCGSTDGIHCTEHTTSSASDALAAGQLRCIPARRAQSIVGMVRPCMACFHAVLHASWTEVADYCGCRLQSTGIQLAMLGIYGPLPNTDEAMELTVDSEHHWFHQSVSFVVVAKPERAPAPWMELDLASTYQSASKARPFQTACAPWVQKTLSASAPASKCMQLRRHWSVHHISSVCWQRHIDQADMLAGAQAGSVGVLPVQEELYQAGAGQAGVMEEQPTGQNEHHVTGEHAAGHTEEAAEHLHSTSSKAHLALHVHQPHRSLRH